MKSELETNEHVTDFVSAGQKNYVYKATYSVSGANKNVYKVRGINLHFSAMQIVNFDRLNDIILTRDPKDTVTVRTDK
jgi:hypothetical protein